MTAKMRGKKGSAPGGLTAVIRQLTASMEASFNTVNRRFDTLETRFDTLEPRFDGRINQLEGLVYRIELRQIETNKLVEDIDGRLQGVEADIKELYDITADLQREIEQQALPYDEVARRLDNLELFTRDVAYKTGLPLPV